MQCSLDIIIEWISPKDFNTNYKEKQMIISIRIVIENERVLNKEEETTYD